MIKSEEVGYVISSRDFLVYLDGLPSVKNYDIVVSGQGIRALVHGLYPDKVEVLILDEGQVSPGELFKHSKDPLGIVVGDYLLGRAVNPLGVPIDGRGLLSKSDKDPLLQLDQTASGIDSRQFITQQFVTGISLIDSLIPIGKGQRELIMGDAHSGKTSFLIDLIVNQRNSDVICIYASIGKPITQVRMLIDILNANQALDHSIIVAASSSEPAPLIFLTPFTAFTIAEYLQRQGRDVLLILDDLGIHAKIYREISLLGNRPPGRESYPGDIFYQHSHLVERAGNFKKEYGGGSITAIPVIELNLNDFTTFIPTNLMSMTDGHLMFKASLHNQGQRPAIDIPLSVSRVGRQTQKRVQNLLSQKIRQVLAESESLETVSRFSSELPYETQLLLHQKEIINEMITQDSLTLIPLEVQICLLGLVFTSFFNDQNIEFVKKNKKKLIECFLKDPQITPVVSQVTKMETDTQLFQLLESLKPKLIQVCSTH